MIDQPPKPTPGTEVTASASQLSPTQQRMLNSMTSLIKGLAKSPELGTERTDSFLQRVSELPIIKSVLDDQHTEFHDYVKGVAMIIQSLLEKAQNDDEGRQFLRDVRKIYNEIFPSPVSVKDKQGNVIGEIIHKPKDQAIEPMDQTTQPKDHAHEDSMEISPADREPAAENDDAKEQSQLNDQTATSTTSQNPPRLDHDQIFTPKRDDSDDLECLGSISLNPRTPAHGLPHLQPPSQPSSSTSRHHNSGPMTTDRHRANNNHIITPQRSSKRQHAPQTEDLHSTNSLLTTRPPKQPRTIHPPLALSPPPSTPNTWETIQFRALSHLPHTQQHTPLRALIPATVTTLSHILGWDAMTHLRAMQNEYSHPRPTQGISWSAVPQLTTSRELWLVCRHYAARRPRTPMDSYGTVLARVELARDGRGEEGEVSEGLKLRVLVEAWGRGVLVLVSGGMVEWLQQVDREALRLVLAAVAAVGGERLKARIQDVCARAQGMIDASLRGTSVEFHLAAEDVVEKLERLSHDLGSGNDR